jgi:hypothetical protein
MLTAYAEDTHLVPSNGGLHNKIDKVEGFIMFGGTQI